MLCCLMFAYTHTRIQWPPFPRECRQDWKRDDVQGLSPAYLGEFFATMGMLAA